MKHNTFYNIDGDLEANNGTSSSPRSSTPTPPPTQEANVVGVLNAQNTISQQVLQYRSWVTTEQNVTAYFQQGIALECEIQSARVTITPFFQAGQGWAIYFNDRETGNLLSDEVIGSALVNGIEVTEKYGCTDSTALNYDPTAANDDGSCEYEPEEETIRGCTDAEASNYDPLANSDDGSCIYQEDNEIYGCTDPAYDNYDPAATIDSGGCANVEFGDTPDVEGCMDSSYDNYNPYATINVGCKNFDINTEPTGNADNSDLYAGLLTLDGEYGDLIADTIELIQNLQVAYEEALANEGVPQSDVIALQNELTAAQSQLNDILSTDGLLNVISDAVIAAEEGNHNPAPLNAISSELVDAPNGQSGTQYITAINNALQTISDYANSTSDYDSISEDLENALSNINSLDADNASLQASLDEALANQEDGISQADVDAVQAELTALTTEYENFLSNVSIYLGIANLDTYTLDPTDQSVQPTIANIGDLAMSYNELANTLANLQDDTADLAYTAEQYNDLMAQYEAAMANQEDGISQADVDAAIIATTNAAIDALSAAGVNTASLSQADLTQAIQTYIAQYIANNNLVTASDIMLTNDELADEITNAIIQYVNNFIAGTQADAALTAYIQDQVNTAVDTAVGNITPEDGVSQADVDAAVAAAQAEAAAILAGVQGELEAAQAEIATLTDLLTAGAGTNALSNQTLQAAYDLIEQMEADAEAQFQVYANDIAAYEDFLSSLSDSMATLENFLTNNYGYDPTGEVKFTIPTSTPNFSGGSMPLPDIYLNFAGKTIGVTQGFRNFKGVAPMRNANGTSAEATFELNESTRKILWGAGIVIFTLGAFQLIKRQ